MVKRENLPFAFKILQFLLTIAAAWTIVRLLLTLYNLYLFNKSLSIDNVRDLIELAALLGLVKRKYWAWLLELILNIRGIVLAIFLFLQNPSTSALVWILIPINLTFILILFFYKRFYNR